MSVQHMTWAYKQDLPPGTRFVLVTIANFADGSGHCYPGQGRLASMTGFNVRSIRNHVLKLEEAGLIKRTSRRREDGMKTSDSYQLIMSPAEIAGKDADATESPAKSAATHRQKTTQLPAKSAARNTVRSNAETPSPTQNEPTLPANSSGSTIRLTTSNNHQDKPPTPFEDSKSKKSGFDPLEVDLPGNVSPTLWADFVAHRSEIRKKLTPTATKRLLANLESFGASANDALKTSVANGWTGVFPPKNQTQKTKTSESDVLDQYKELGL